jgi:chromate transport protein ChrA
MSLTRFRTNHPAQVVLAGLVPAAVGMLAALGVLVRSGLEATLSFGVAMLAFLLILRAKLHTIFVILGCGLLQLVIAHWIF